jgi:L-threonylcarbamoyladenylate synthase
MNYFTERNDPALAALLQRGAIGVLKTDTLYGIVASARDRGAVERVFLVRGRDRNKACIILIADMTDVFDKPDMRLEEFMGQQWPGPVSVVVASPSAPDYLQFSDGSIAYRLPADDELRALLKTTGPLIAPSANLQGKPPAKSIDEARAYFGEKVDFYADSGEVTNVEPSQLWTYKDGDMQRLR